jgi:type IV secretory pathway TraG/TraD family ATPase VirD4
MERDCQGSASKPLLLPHEVLQLDTEQVIAFAGSVPPMRLGRVDWRGDRDGLP